MAAIAFIRVEARWCWMADALEEAPERASWAWIEWDHRDRIIRAGIHTGTTPATFIVDVDIACVVHMNRIFRADLGTFGAPDTMHTDGWNIEMADGCSIQSDA